MGLDGMTQNERQSMFQSQGGGETSEIAQQLVEMKAAEGYTGALSSVSATYDTSTNTITFPTTVHYISIYSDGNANFVFNASDAADANSKLANDELSHFILGGERLNFGLPNMGVTRIDLKASSGSVSVRVSAFRKATNFSD